MSKLSSALRVAVRCAVALAAVSTLSVAVAQQVAVNVNIEAQSVDAALRELSRQTNTNILFSPAAVQGLKSTSINAVMTAEEAAKALTAGTELEVVRDLTGALIVRRRSIIAEPSFKELNPTTSRSIGGSSWRKSSSSASDERSRPRRRSSATPIPSSTR